METRCGNFLHPSAESISSVSIQDELNLPDHIWEIIVSKVGCNNNDDRHLKPLSLVSKQLLSITNRFKRTLTTCVSSTPQTLRKLFSRFPNLVQFSIRGKISDEFILELARFEFPLQVLDLSGLRFPVSSIAHLPLSTRTTVSSLILKDCEYASHNDVGTIVDLFPNLEELDISRRIIGQNLSSRSLEDKEIGLVASKKRGLRRINLEGNSLLSDLSLRYLCKNCVNLEEIVLNDCRTLTEDGVNLVFTCFENLKLIGLPVVSHEIAHAISSARSLRELHLSSLFISDELLSVVANADLPLKCFSLSQCMDFTIDGLMQLVESYQYLEYLDLKSVRCLQDWAMVQLTGFLQNAKTVKLNYCRNLSMSSFFVIIKSCVYLDTLEMENALSGNEKLCISKARNPNIKVLNLSSNYDLSDHSLCEITLSCPGLEVLKMNRCPKISGTGIGHVLRNCCGLRHLQIEGCKAITDLQLANEGHEKLEVLKMGGCTNIEDQVLYSVALKCPELRYLQLPSWKRFAIIGGQMEELMN